MTVVIPTFDSKGWSLWGLSYTGKYISVKMSSDSLGKTYGGGTLALSKWGRGDPEITLISEKSGKIYTTKGETVLFECKTLYMPEFETVHF